MRLAFKVGDWVVVRTCKNQVAQIREIDTGCPAHLVRVRVDLPDISWVFPHECRRLDTVPKKHRAKSSGRLRL